MFRTGTCFLLLLTAPVCGAARQWDRAQVVTQAISVSQVLANYQASIDENLAGLHELSSGRSPSLSLTASSTYLTPSISFPAGSASITTAVPWNYSLGLSYRQLILDFGKTAAREKAKHLAVRVSEMDLADQRSRLAEEILVRFEDACQAEDMLEVTRQSLQARTSALRVARLRLQAGLVPHQEVVAAQTELAQARRADLQAQSEQRTALGNLFLYLGIEDCSQECLNASAFCQSALPDPKEWDHLLDSRFDLQAARLAWQESKENLKVAELDDSPSLSLQSDYLRRNPTATQGDYQWSTGLVLNWPLWDGGLAEARQEKAQAAANRFEAQYRELRRQALQEVRTLYESEKTSLASQEFYAQARENAAESARVSRLRYANGLANRLELEQAESKLTSAEGDSVTARHQLEKLRIHCWRALGQNFSEGPVRPQNRPNPAFVELRAPVR